MLPLRCNSKERWRTCFFQISFRKQNYLLTPERNKPVDSLLVFSFMVLQKIWLLVDLVRSIPVLLSSVLPPISVLFEMVFVV